MAAVGSDLQNVLVGERELWQGGPPHELFKRLRGECPIHFTERISEYPREAGYWSVTTAEDIHTVSRDWRHLLLRARRRHGRLPGLSAGAHARHVHRHGSAEARPPEGALPGGLHAQDGSPTTRSAIQADRHTRPGPDEGRETCDLVTEVAQPVVSRVIGSFMGIPEEDDEIWARLMNNTSAPAMPTSTPRGSRPCWSATCRRSSSAAPS